MYCQVTKKKPFFGNYSFCMFSNNLCLGRVFLALVERQEDRGAVVAQGGGKVELHRKSLFYKLKIFCLRVVIISLFSPPQALIPLATDNTNIGKVKAAQALAKIAITSNPEIAFPGERVKMHAVTQTI